MALIFDDEVKRLGGVAPLVNDVAMVAAEVAALRANEDPQIGQLTADSSTSLEHFGQRDMDVD